MVRMYQVVSVMLVVVLSFVSFQWYEAAGSRDSYYESLQNEHQMYAELESHNRYLVAECDRWQREASKLRSKESAVAAETVVSLLSDQVAADVRQQLAPPPTPVGSMFQVLGDWAKNGVPKVQQD